MEFRKVSIKVQMESLSKVLIFPYWNQLKNLANLLLPMELFCELSP